MRAYIWIADQIEQQIRSDQHCPGEKPRSILLLVKIKSVSIYTVISAMARQYENSHI